jgi:hypothetical protein
MGGVKIDFRTILILVLTVAVIVLVLFQGCGDRPIVKGIEVEVNFDSIERVIKSQLPPPDTIVIEPKTIVRWLPSATVVDTVYVSGETKYIYNAAPIDTAAILTHYLTQAITYVDTIRDSSLQVVISDTIFRNNIVYRDFRYKILRPTETKYIDNRDKFQLIASFQAGGGMSYANVSQSIYIGADLGLKFKSGTYFSVGYMAGSGHFATIRAGQVIRLRKR